MWIRHGTPIFPRNKMFTQQIVSRDTSWSGILDFSTPKKRHHSHAFCTTVMHVLRFIFKYITNSNPYYLWLSTLINDVEKEGIWLLPVLLFTARTADLGDGLRAHFILSCYGKWCNIIMRRTFGSCGAISWFLYHTLALTTVIRHNI